MDELFTTTSGICIGVVIGSLIVAAPTYKAILFFEFWGDGLSDKAMTLFYWVITIHAFTYPILLWMK